MQLLRVVATTSEDVPNALPNGEYANAKLFILVSKAPFTLYRITFHTGLIFTPK